MITTGAQIRAARALLGWKQDELASAADVHPNAIAYWERLDSFPARARGRSYACHHIERALKAAGIEILSEPTAGVRFCAPATH
jgi:transcriptional regulator with XRE-family HTH domain